MTLTGYSALIDAHNLKGTAPDHLCVIGTKYKKFTRGRWRYFTPKHQPRKTLYCHLTFALKYEGIDLAVLNALFQTIKTSKLEIQAIEQKYTEVFSLDTSTHRSEPLL